jgi:hypothetical protein
MNQLTSLLALVSLALAACATSNTANTASDTPEPVQREYRTGSRIPIKDPVPMTKEEKEKQAEDARATLANSPRPYAPRPGS